MEKEIQEEMIAQQQQVSTQAHMFNSNTLNADLMSSYESCNAKRGSTDVLEGQIAQNLRSQLSAKEGKAASRPTELSKNVS